MFSLLRKAVSKLRKVKTRNAAKVLFKGRSKFRMLTVIENRKNHTRVMYAGNKLFMAGIDTRTGFPTDHTYFLADIFAPRPNFVLVLGGGPNAVPTYVWRHYRPKSVHVVERDYLTTLLAKRFFKLPRNKGFKVFHQDAKDFLRRSRNKYDVIYFNLGLTRKRGLKKDGLFELSSQKGIENLANRLRENGVVIYVIIARLEGQDLVFLEKCLSYFKKSFASCYVFSDFQKRPSKIQTVVFVATNAKTSLQKEYTTFLDSRHRMHPKKIYETLMTKLIDKPWKLS